MKVNTGSIAERQDQIETDRDPKTPMSDHHDYESTGGFLKPSLLHNPIINRSSDKKKRQIKRKKNASDSSLDSIKKD